MCFIKNGNFLLFLRLKIYQNWQEFVKMQTLMNFVFVQLTIWAIPARCHDSQHDDTWHNCIQHNYEQIVTLSITQLSLMALEGVLLCWVSRISTFSWLPLIWMSLYWMSLCGVSLCWVALCWVSLYWMSWYPLFSSLPLNSIELVSTINWKIDGSAYSRLKASLFWYLQKLKECKQTQQLIPRIDTDV